MEGLPPKMVDLLGCLPIANVNAQLVEYLATLGSQGRETEALRDEPGEAVPTVFACVFAADPLYEPSHLIDDLRAAKIYGIANFPSLGVLEGRFAEVMSASGFDFQRELHCLEFAKRQGLRTAAVVWSEEQGRAGLQAHPDQIVVHPGGFLRHAATTQVAADKTMNLVRTLQCDSSGIPILIYRHPSLHADLSRAAAIADGTIEFGKQTENGTQLNHPERFAPSVGTEI
jgi:predicted TIM-barrel enzyme